MYHPSLGRFQSRDPLGANGVDVLHDNNWFGHRLALMRNHYGYANNNPSNFIDPSGLLACDDDEGEDEKCGGACFVGKETTITKCSFTKVVIEKGSDGACHLLVTSKRICDQLTDQFEAANVSAEDPKKFPSGIWIINKCTEGCECKKGYMLKKGPQKFELKDRTVTSTGKIKIYGEVTCVVTLTGTVEVDGGGFALVECEKSK